MNFHRLRIDSDAKWWKTRIYLFSLKGSLTNNTLPIDAIHKGKSLSVMLYILLQKKTFYCNDSKITEFEKIDTKNSSTDYVVMYKLII